MTANQTGTPLEGFLELLDELFPEALAAAAAEFNDEPDDLHDEDWDDPHAGEDLPTVPAKVAAQRCATDLLIEVDLPGVAAENVSIRMTEKGLHVRGVRRPLVEYSDRKTLMDGVERGPYEALINLNTKVAPDDLNAVVTDGVLEIYVQDVFDAKQEEFDVPVEAG